jgi:hypothetical protein
MDMTDWILLTVGLAVGYMLAKRQGALAGSATPMQQASGVSLQAGDRLNPGSARSSSPADAVDGGLQLLNDLNAAPGGTDAYATIFSSTVPGGI